MPMLHDPNIHVTWQKLCAVFARRNTIVPRWKELIPTLRNWNNDQVTWHRQHNVSWKEAVEIAHPLSTPTLRALCLLAEENLGHHKSMMVESSALLMLVSGFVTIAVGVVKDLMSSQLSVSSGFLARLPEGTIVWWALAGGFLAGLLCSHMKAWISLRQARELGSCLRGVLTERLATDDHGHP